MYLRPRTLEEACDALAAAPAVILSGGTDIYPGLVDRLAPARIVDLSRIEGLSGIVTTGHHVAIGARTTWSAILAADLPPCFDALKAAAREIGSVQIQNVATIGGNICNASPAADSIPALLALDAEVELACASGSRRLALGDFLRGSRLTARRADEVMTCILVPRAPDDARSSFRKLGARRYLVISIVMTAAIVRMENGRVGEARVAVGSCSAVARRLPALETALRGVDVGSGLAHLVRAEHLAPLAPIDDLRASAAYRLEAARELVGRALDACLAEEP